MEKCWFPNLKGEIREGRKSVVKLSECDTGYHKSLAFLYTLFQNGRHLDILLFSFKLDLDASFKAKYSFEF